MVGAGSRGVALWGWLRSGLLCGGFGVEQQIQHVPDATDGTEHHQPETDRDLLTGGLGGVLGVDGKRQRHEDPELDSAQDHPEQ